MSLNNHSAGPRVPDSNSLPSFPDHCLCCRQPNGKAHDEACVQAEHEAMLAGDPAATAEHEPDECYHCLLEEVASSICRCGNCCRALIIEACLQDAEVEPRIKERCPPVYTGPEFTASGERELQGYMLNGKNGHCVFLDDASNLCTIYATRPLVCRLFQYDGCEVSGLLLMAEQPS